MDVMRKLPLVALMLFLINDDVQGKNPNLYFKNGDYKASIIGKIETTTELDINGVLFNSNVPDDLFANKTKVDISLLTKTPTSQSKVTLRNKVVWGNHRVIFTDDAFLKTLDGTATSHFHTIGPNMVWIREAWVEADMSKLCHMENVLKQTLTIGSFSFILGRGISLGDAYSVNPALLGFFQDNSVDQYAWGVKVSGGLIKDFMSYDTYLSVLSNKSTSLRETILPTQLKSFGTSQKAPWRGAGDISFVTAARFLITPMVEEDRKLSFEPYIMYHHDPEQKVEYFCDAKSNLGTGGFACELVTESLEVGFDCASNFGHQDVKGWDRNQINSVNTGGYYSFVYSDVFNVDPNVTTPTAANNVLYDPQNSAQKKAIANVAPGAVSNGQPIAGTSNPTLYNSLTRYRMPYTTQFRGYMWVGDASYWLVPKELVVSATWGMASGDQNPNANLKDPNDVSVDGNYNGFIPFQELYAGKRVLSFFGMTSLITRPLDIPNTGDDFAVTVDNFSNVIFYGMGVKYAPQKAKSKWNINPNVIMYWQDVASNKFDLMTGQTSKQPASKEIGVEANTFFVVNLSESLSITGGIGLFVPGQHYADIKGKPVSADQSSALASAIATIMRNLPPYAAGPLADLQNLPLIVNDVAYSASIAMGYSF